MTKHTLFDEKEGKDELKNAWEIRVKEQKVIKVVEVNIIT